MNSINTDSNKDNSDTNLPDHPPSIRLQGGKDTQNRADQSKQKTSKPDKSTTIFEKIMIFANICLVILTVVLAIANWNISKDSREQLKIAKQEMTIANTPYFSVMYSKYFLQNDTFAFHACYKNVGKTPALNFRGKTQIFINIRNDIIDTIPDRESQSACIIAPEDSSGADNFIVFNAIQKEEIRFNKINIAVYITMQWEDVFSHKYLESIRESYNTVTKRFIIDNNGNEYKQLH